MDNKYPDYGVCQICQDSTLHSCLDDHRERIYLRTCTKCGRKVQIVDGVVNVLFMGRKLRLVKLTAKKQRSPKPKTKEKKTEMRTAEFTHRDASMVAAEIELWKDDNHHKIVVVEESLPQIVKGQCRVIIRYHLAPARKF